MTETLPGPHPETLAHSIPPTTHDAEATPLVTAWRAGTEGGAGFVLVCMVWILAHPYQGVWHDAILYVGQALHVLWPDVLGRDLFFSHGSQDQFTLVATPLGWLLSHFGMAGVELALTAACNLAFAAAVWTLCGLLVPAHRWIATLSVALLSHAYGRLTLFNYAENFFTARSLAEPLVLWALVAWQTRRRLRGSILFGLALLIHPLVTVPALVVAWALRLADDRRWLWGLAVVAPIAVLAWGGIAPFAGLFQRYDDAWWSVIDEFDRQVRLTDWEAVDLVGAILDAMFLGIALPTLLPLARRFALTVLCSAALLMLVAYVGGDILRDVLLVQLQLWRALWLTHLLAMICLPVIAIDYWRRGDTGRLVAAAAVAAELAISWTLPYSWIFLAWLAAAAAIHRRPDNISRPIVRAALAATLLTIVSVSTVIAVVTYRLIAGDTRSTTVAEPVLAVLTTPTLAVLSTLAIMLLLGRLPRWSAVTLAFVLLVLCMPRWDQRSDWRRTVEAMPLAQHPFAGFIPRSAQVYWHFELLPTWAMLGRASYVSSAQASGIVFNRGTAMDFAERNKPLLAVLNQQVACQMAANAAGTGVECQPEQALVEAFCKMPLPPDFMVFDERYSRGLVAQWDYRVTRGAPLHTSFLYDCSKMR